MTEWWAWRNAQDGSVVIALGAVAEKRLDGYGGNCSPKDFGLGGSGAVCAMLEFCVESNRDRVSVRMVGEFHSMPRKTYSVDVLGDCLVGYIGAAFLERRGLI